MECGNQAILNPVLLLYPFIADMVSPVTVTLHIGVCEEHAIENPELFMTNDSWDSLKESILQYGSMELPDRDLSDIEFRLIDKNATSHLLQ